MTDEQVKQNAEAYAKKIYPYTVGKAAAIRDFIAGVHSLDEEIEELQNELESLRKGFYEQGNKLKELIKKLMLANNKLRNPWINVEERLPEKLENDCASYYVLTRMDGPRQIWYMVNRYNYNIKSWEGCSNTTTHWMPIPELKKGE